MKAAQIESNKVVNVIEIATAEDAPKFNAVICGDDIGIGWSYDGSDFTAPIQPDPTPEQIQRQLEAENQQRKMDGILFNGVMCSATGEDMWGLSSIRVFVQAGSEANFKFKNGNILTLTAANYDAFEAVWIPFRASFFTDEG